MASVGSSTVVDEMESNLERIKRQLTSTTARHLLQGPLLKRSDTLRKWNERWVILDPTTGKMEYKLRKNDAIVRGMITFDSTSNITWSPLNFHGLPKYEGCCFYISTPQKMEYFLCAETPGAARAWVSTLHATQLVLRAHKDAVDSLAGNGSAKLGTVATVVAVANATAVEASKEIEAPTKISMRGSLGSTMNKPTNGQLDDLTIMIETLRVKDEELNQVQKEMRARDSTIREIADRLREAAQAAEVAASAAHSIDEEKRLLCAELEKLRHDLENQIESNFRKLRESEERVILLTKEKELLLQERDCAVQEAQLLRSELGKARGNAVILEAAVVRAQEKARVGAVDAAVRMREASEKVEAAAKEKEELLARLHVLQSSLDSQDSETKQICGERSDLRFTADEVPLSTKHMDSVEDNVDKACLSDSELVPVTHGVDIRTIDYSEMNQLRASDGGIDEGEGTSLDIPVDNQPATREL